METITITENATTLVALVIVSCLVMGVVQVLTMRFVDWIRYLASD